MSNAESVTCPHCGNSFDPGKHLEYGVYGLGGLFNLMKTAQGSLDHVFRSNHLECPSCLKTFEYSEYRYFGFLSKRHIYLFFILFVLAMLIGGIIFLILPLYTR